jgi:hypothetical protein
MGATEIERHEKKTHPIPLVFFLNVLIGIWRLTDERETPRTIYCRGR